jgi:hypothetical protein
MLHHHQHCIHTYYIYRNLSLECLFMTISLFHTGHQDHTAMEQHKLKKVMKLTHMWIQDTKFTYHASTMEFNQWMKVRPRTSEVSVFKFEVNVIWSGTKTPLKDWKLVDIGRCSANNCESTYLIGTDHTASTQSQLQEHLSRLNKEL